MSFSDGIVIGEWLMIITFIIIALLLKISKSIEEKHKHEITYKKFRKWALNAMYKDNQFGLALCYNIIIFIYQIDKLPFYKRNKYFNKHFSELNIPLEPILR